MFRRNNTYTDEELEKRGNEIASLLFIQARELATEIKKQSGENDKFSNNDYFRLLSFCTALFYLYIDRQLFTKLGAERRDKVFDNIERAHMGMLKHNYDLSGDSLNKAGAGMYDAVAALTPFAHQFFPEGKDSPKGTLMWEFDKLLGSIGFAPGTWSFANEVSIELMKPIKRLLDELFK